MSTPIAGCFLGPGGPMRWEDLTPFDRAAVEEFREWLAARKATKECGCTPERECERHFLDEDDRMRRLTDV